MTETSPRRRLRQIFAGDRCYHPASVFDPISMRIAEDLGFETAMFAGSIASYTVLGAPDLIVLTLSEFADQARRICRDGRLPLLVDADHGYGNALSVKRTVEELETAGVSAMTIEDTLLPKRFGAKETEFLSIAEGVGKMKAALKGRSDPDLLILGRTSSIGRRGVEDAVDRAKAYLDAGVDAIMFVGVKTRADLERIARDLDAPVMIGGSPVELHDLGDLAGLKVRICLQGHQPFQAAVQAVHDTLAALRRGVSPKELQGVASAELMKRVTRESDYDAWDKDFLSE